MIPVQGKRWDRLAYTDLRDVPPDQREFERTRRAEAKRMQQEHAKEREVFQELQNSLDNFTHSLEEMRGDIQNLAQKVSEKDDNAVLIQRLNEITRTLRTLDAHELRKIAERLLSKTEAEEKYEARLQTDRLRRNRWREKNE
jgi:TolA-binding protein